MEKIIKIEVLEQSKGQEPIKRRYEFPAKSTAASLFSYKANFGRDGIKDLMKLSKSMPKDKGEIGEDFELDVFYRFLWTFAKSADKDIKPMIEWLEGFDMLPFDFLKAALPQVQEMLVSTVASTVKSKN